MQGQRDPTKSESASTSSSGGCRRARNGRSVFAHRPGDAARNRAGSEPTRRAQLRQEETVPVHQLDDGLTGRLGGTSATPVQQVTVAKRLQIPIGIVHAEPFELDRDPFVMTNIQIAFTGSAASISSVARSLSTRGLATTSSKGARRSRCNTVRSPATPVSPGS